MKKNLIAYVAAVAVTYILAVLCVSQLNIQQIVSLGYPVGVADRMQTAWHDLGGMLQSYLPLIAIGLLIALLVTRWLLQPWLKRSLGLYVLAGFVAVITIHFALHTAFGITPVAASRTLAGLMIQAVAGAVGGAVFFKLTQHPTNRL